MFHEGYICGYKVVYEQSLCMWDKGYPGETVYAIKKCLMVLPPDITEEEFLRGMMWLTRGKVNPTIIKEIYNEVHL